MTRIVVVGGVAAGMTAASQAKRRAPDSEVIVFERSDFVSYSACSMPYNIADPDQELDALLVLAPERLRHDRGLDVRLRHEVVAIETAAKQVRVRNLDSAEEQDVPYDQLVIATGAQAVPPPISDPGAPGVFVLHDLSHAAAIKEFLRTQKPRRAIVAGAGYIGLEMTETLRRRGLSVTLLAKNDPIMRSWHPAIATVVEAELERQQVHLEKGAALTEIQGPGPALSVQTARGSYPAELVLVATGIRPNVALARAAGLRLGATGAIAVDEQMRTSAPNVFAAGDCAETYHRLKTEPVYLPLGDIANKQGKVAGANAVGARETYAGVVGSAAFKVFDLEVARTGLGAEEAEALGHPVVSSVSTHPSFAHGYPNAQKITTVLVVEKPSGRLLGAQMVGAATVGKRIDVLATALHAGLSVYDIEKLDLAYAPPISPVYDPVLIAATVARKAMARARRE